MPEQGSAAGMLLAAVIACVAGMGWLALAMQPHAQQVWGRAQTRTTARLLRTLGALGIAAALVLCLAVDHASMAVLVWVMTLAGSSLLVAFTLSWHPHWLGMLAPWVRRAR